MRVFQNKITFSPTDLTRFFESEFTSYMDHFEKIASESLKKELGVERDPLDPLLELIKKLGIQHEETSLAEIEKTEPVFKIEAKDRDSAIKQTLSALQAGEPNIYQAALQKDKFFGYADLLVKQQVVKQQGQSALGNYYYTPWDFKLSKKPKPTALIQLCCYCEMLESIQKIRPPQFAVITKEGKPHYFETKDFFDFYLVLKEKFLSFHKEFSTHTIPIPKKSALHRDWNEFAQKRLLQTDDVSLTAGIRAHHVTLLKRQQVNKLTELAQLKNLNSLKDIPLTTLKNLKQQADIQVKSRGKHPPLYKVIPAKESFALVPSKEGGLEIGSKVQREGLALLPPKNLGDVFFDMEGWPLFGETGLEYLYGNVVYEDSPFVSFWAFNEEEEEKTFKQWMDWITNRRKKYPSMHIYHYGHYEPSAVKKLMGKYGVREQEVDDLLRNQVFVDLYRVVTQGLKVGTTSYSLKDIEQLCNKKRATDIKIGSEAGVEFFHFLESKDVSERSAILKRIEDYNRDDCVSTKDLCQFLWKEQKKHNIPYVPYESYENKKSFKKPLRRTSVRELCEQKAEEILNHLELNSLKENNTVYKTARLLSDLLMFHIREDKPGWWDYFTLEEMSQEELLDSKNIIAFCKVIEEKKPLYKIQFEEQEVSLQAKDEVIILEKKNPFQKVLKIKQVDLIQNTLLLETPWEHSFPTKGPFTLIPKVEGHYKQNILKSLLYTARSFNPQAPFMGLKKHLHDLLLRKTPDIHKGSLIHSSLEECVLNLNHSVLCIQGPPGAGKTWTVADMILHLVKHKKRIGVTANSHKAIENVLKTVSEKKQAPILCQKVSSSLITEEQHLLKGTSVEIVTNKQVKGTADVVGGTTFFFSRSEEEDQYDYLFVDEASQTSLANIISAGRATKNLVLVGDQNQLDQPVKAFHPGEANLSALTYYTEGKATIPKEKGVFLSHSYRMHPKIGDLISHYFYNGKLKSHSSTEKQKIIWPEKVTSLFPSSGIYFIPIEHTGNTHTSKEEAQKVSELYKQLLNAKWLNSKGVINPITEKDILIVAPYNRQIACIKEAEPSALAASVDKFQGQEAVACILSLTSSTLEEAPRGVSFLLNQNRLNTALSRARCLSLVVCSKHLIDITVRSIDNIKRVNILCGLSRSRIQSIS